MTLFYEKMKYYSIIVLAFALMALASYVFMPYKSESLGFLLGLLFNFLNLWTIYRKTIVVGRIADTVLQTRTISTIIGAFGFVIRVTMAILAIWLALRFPHTFNLLWVIIGFVLIYIIILIDISVQSLRKR